MPDESPSHPGTPDQWQARPRWRVSRGGEIALGPGKVALLTAIGREGSISGAARALDMSYRRAWLLVETMNRSFRRPLVVTSRWRRGGATLTAEGERALELYQQIEAISLAATSNLLSELLELLVKRRDA